MLFCSVVGDSYIPPGLEFNFHMDSYAARVVLQRTYLSNTTITLVCTDVLDKLDLTLVNFMLICFIHKLLFYFYNTQPIYPWLYSHNLVGCRIIKQVFIKLLFIFYTLNLSSTLKYPLFSHPSNTLFSEISKKFIKPSYNISSCAINHLIHSLQLGGTHIPVQDWKRYGRLLAAIRYANDYKFILSLDCISDFVCI